MRKMKPSGVEWIGDIPQEWEVRRIKNLFSLRDERNDKPLCDVNLISLYTDLGVVQRNDVECPTGNKASNADGYKLVYENDIVVNIILCWMGAIGRSNFSGVTSPAYDIYAPLAEANSYYYHYYVRTTGFSGDCYKRGKGIMAMRWRTYSDEFRDIRVVYPPFPEQQRIAEFLDRKCAEIDSIIAKTKATVEEYKALKQAVITQAVTKGIRPDRPMKDSGVEWIGDIPQEWSKDKVFRVFSTIGSGTTPKSSDESKYEGNINWIQSGDINGRILSEVKNRLSIEAIDKYSALRIYTSPFIVIAMYGASIGNISISKIDSCVNQACCVLAEPKININYAFQSIKAAKNYLITKAVGGGQPNISQDIVKSLWLPIPPLLEQQEIADYLDRKCAEIDRLIAAKEQLLTELESYKKSVIYEYVTGKKEV